MTGDAGSSPERGAGPDGVVRVWGLEFFETDAGKKPVLDWIRKDLSPTKRRAVGSAMRRVLQVHGPGVTRSGWGKSVGSGVFEFRVRMNGKQVITSDAEIHGITESEARARFNLNPSEDVLLRVFCTVRAGKLILLLHAYDKGTDANKKRQQTEIAEAVRRKKLDDQREARKKKP